MNKTRNDNRLHRVKRVRARISGTSLKPRLRVFRSLTNFSAQLIDDTLGKTVVSVTLSDVKGAKNSVEGVTSLGAEFAKRCKDAKIESLVFDRGGYRYHGKVKAFADAVRENGFEF